MARAFEQTKFFIPGRSFQGINFAKLSMTLSVVSSTFMSSIIVNNIKIRNVFCIIFRELPSVNILWAFLARRLLWQKEL